MGKLGLPKLAVAIGNFRKITKLLFTAMPQLLEQAWQSVEHITSSSLTFRQRRSDTAWTPAQKIAEFQEVMMQRRLATALISLKHWQRWLLKDWRREN